MDLVIKMYSVTWRSTCEQVFIDRLVKEVQSLKLRPYTVHLVNPMGQ